MTAKRLLIPSTTKIQGGQLGSMPAPSRGSKARATPVVGLALLAAVTLTSCFSGKGDTSKVEPEPAPKEENATRNLGDSGIIFTFPQALDKSSIKIQLKGYSDIEVKAISPGDPDDLGMAVRGLNSGRYDAYITAKARGSNTEHAAYVSGIEVSRDEFANYNLTHFAPSSTVKGNVRVIGHSQHGDVAIAVQGIPVSAKTDSDGNFTLPFLPAGTYDIVFSRSDLRLGRMSQMSIDQATINLGTVAMKKSAEFAGLITIHEVKPAATDGKYLLDMIIADTKPDAALIKFNHQDNGWDGIAWRPFRSSIQTEWKKNSTNQIYVQIANSSKKVLTQKVKVVQMQPATPAP